MEFKDVTVEDREWARALLSENNYQSCEFAFVNIFMWSKVSTTKLARFEDFAIARSYYYKDQSHYLYPAGHGDIKAAIEAVLEDATHYDRLPIIYSIPAHLVDGMKEMFPDYFEYSNPREFIDYMYLASDLADLKGKKFQKKRNHCSRFERTYPNWEFHEITPDSLQAVCDFNNKWCNLYDNRDDEGIAIEHQAIEKACRHYDELHLKGGYITVDGEVVAFSFGSPLNPTIFDTHVEKALYDVNGAYNMINREMARNFCRGYTYINRENDLGEEGLREAKLSYQPALLVDKFRAIPKDWPKR